MYLYEQEKINGLQQDEAIKMLHEVSALTHGHIRSQIACGLYYFIVKAILEQIGSLEERMQQGIDWGFDYYETFSQYKDTSVQEFRLALSQQINQQVIFATFVKNVETTIKSNTLVKALKSVLLSFGYHG